MNPKILAAICETALLQAGNAYRVSADCGNKVPKITESVEEAGVMLDHAYSTVVHHRGGDNEVSAPGQTFFMRILGTKHATLTDVRRVMSKSGKELSG